MKKTRVNSRINNIKGKTSNSFKTRRQGWNRVTRDKAIGYCLFHQVYIDGKIIKIKKCNECPRFIKLEKKGEETR